MTTNYQISVEDKGISRDTVNKTNQKVITVTNKINKPVVVSSSIKYGKPINGNTILGGGEDKTINRNI